MKVIKLKFYEKETQREMLSPCASDKEEFDT